MSSYEALAGAYDALTYDIPYEKMLSFWEEILCRAGVTPASVLDLACGTGSLTRLLCQRGYEVTASDLSQEMLTEAMDKVADLDKNRPQFICQSMQDLTLPYKVDWVVSCLDSINYLTDPADCRETFQRVYTCLNHGGMFTFDVNSREKLQALDGQVWLDETEDTYCVWRTEFEENICYYGVDLFTRQGDTWRRDWEEHQQYAYSQEELTEFLTEAGFQNIRFYGDFTYDAPQKGTQRMFVSAIKE